MADKVSYDDKYFIGYIVNDTVEHLCIMLPQMSGYIKCFDKTKYISFVIRNINVLEAYNKLWDKVSCLIKKGFLVSLRLMIII